MLSSYESKNSFVNYHVIFISTDQLIKQGLNCVTNTFIVHSYLNVDFPIQYFFNHLVNT